MELVDGASLERWLADAPRSWRDVLAKFHDAGQGLAAAHRAGVVHRDFKPGNVVLTSDGRAKVVDFGFARVNPQPSETNVAEHVRSAATTTGLSDGAGGTPAYMAPERLFGEPASPASDQYAYCKALSEALRACSSTHARGMQRVPRWLREAVQRGLSPQPSNRWPSMDALLQRLEIRSGSHLRAMAIAGAGVTAVVSVELWRGRLDDDLRRHDVGRLEILVEGSTRELRATIHALTPDGIPVAKPLEHAHATTHAADDAQLLVIDAPAGPVYVALTRDDCGTTGFAIPRFPGHARRGEMQRHHLSLPDCVAGNRGTTLVPEGPFIYSGAGVPPPRHADYVGAEKTVDLPGFLISTNEVSRNEYRAYASLAELTGHHMPPPMPSATKDPPQDGLPITNLSFWEALAFCRFIGGDLPTTEQWEKAFRGGLQLTNGPNPLPRRNLPWGERDEPGRANLADPENASRPADTVAAFTGDVSPYGVHSLAGNVREWTRSIPGEGTGSENPWAMMRVVRGSAFDTAAEAEEHYAAYENMRDPDFVAFDLGFRCVFEERK
jgi:formylglycine-generating enzyme required for sulfatase activity